jgi:RNA polymerase sigma-70 factor (ECF subfamily)
MNTIVEVQSPAAQALSDEEIVARVLAGESGLFELLMRRYNQRVYRTARAILRDDAEAEDVMQDAYVRAYQHLGQFAGRSKFSTWLVRIAVHECLARVQRRSRFQSIDEGEGVGNMGGVLVSRTPDPERNAVNAQAGSLLEEAILGLPESYRSVLMMRDVEEMSTAETAECLNISEENVKTRLHRAHAMLRKDLFTRVGAARANAFTFGRERCDRVVARALERIASMQIL